MNQINFLISMSGSLKIILGPMFSGKSTELIRILNRYKLLNKNILAINHSIDTRYGDNKIITHDKKHFDCKSVSLLMPFLESKEYIESDIIAIEEAQFFDDLFEFTLLSLDKFNKDVVIVGLDGNFKREPFGQILKLIPHCEKIVKLHALCLKCNDGTKASFSKRIINEEKEISVGSGDQYIPVCRMHYNS